MSACEKACMPSSKRRFSGRFTQSLNMDSCITFYEDCGLRVMRIFQRTLHVPSVFLQHKDLQADIR